MEHLIETREGWWWPKHDVACWRYLSRRQDVPKNVSAYSEQKRVVVQAGGNAGMYVKMYEDIFDTVYTFEPDPINFYCLTKNTSTKTIKFQSCLGNNLNLPVVDLIHLDIEGFERFALLGAIETINRCKPIVALELNGLAEKYNHTDNDVKTLMTSLGYNEIGIVDDDAIFKFNG